MTAGAGASERSQRARPRHSPALDAQTSCLRVCTTLLPDVDVSSDDRASLLRVEATVSHREVTTCDSIENLKRVPRRADAYPGKRRVLHRGRICAEDRSRAVLKHVAAGLVGVGDNGSGRLKGKRADEF